MSIVLSALAVLLAISQNPEVDVEEDEDEGANHRRSYWREAKERIE
jgi:hypothetical protein